MPIMASLFRPSRLGRKRRRPPLDTRRSTRETRANQCRAACRSPGFEGEPRGQAAREARTMKATLLAGIATLALATPAIAQLALSANDGKAVLENGIARVLREAPPDTLTVIDLNASPPAIRAEIAVPASVVGPPLSVAITPDERLALVTANQVRDPADPAKLVPGNSMSVVDLSANPPRLVGSVATGLAPAGVSINRAGTMALVANRAEGTVSVFRIANGQVTAAGKVEIGPVSAEVSHV